MNFRNVLSVVSILAGLWLVTAIVAQRRELALARQDEQQLLAQIQPANATAEVAAPPRVVFAQPPLELLRLRSQVTQLMRRKHELSVAGQENARLQTQLAARGTNSSALPPDYIRARDANWVGTSTVESTLQSFLWALRQHDTNALFQLLSARGVESLAQTVQRMRPEAFFMEASLVPGMRIIERRQLPDGSVEAQVELLPGGPESDRLHFQLIQGQWKMDLP